MSATSQHGFHPHAESLSAFAEQALEKRERTEVLEHLAVCGRCRQVVALARDAAGSDGATTARPRKAVASNAWWKQWRLVWVPTAVVAAFAAVSVSVYIEQADRHGPNIKIAKENATPGAAPAPTPPPTEQALALPPASPAPAPPAPSAKQARSAEAEQTPSQMPDFRKNLNQKPQLRLYGFQNENGVRMAQTTPPLSSAGLDGLTNGRPPSSQAYAQQTPPESVAGTAGLAYSQPAAAAWEDKQKQAELHRQAEVDTSRMRVLKARPAPAATDGANQPPPPGSMQTVTVSAAPPLETQPMTLAEPAQIAGIESTHHVYAPVRKYYLPNGLAVVSSTSAGHLVLAIDKEGTLFLSRDRGDTWDRVNTQWTGRAVEVTQLFAVDGALQFAGAAQTQPAANAPATIGPVSNPPLIFELLNDKDQAWVSTDGRIWASK